jgi:hypothetical protein
MTETAREYRLEALEPYVAARVKRIIRRMIERGYDPMIFETRRSAARQAWLYSIGRTTEKHRRPVTWTLKSRHLSGKAADIISRKDMWNAPASFWAALRQEANREGMHVLRAELCHIEWRG